MSAFLTSLASIGSQYGEASNEARAEKRAIADKAQQMDVQQAYLQLAKQAEERQKQEQEFRKKSGDLIEFKDGRIWSVSKGGFIDQQRPDPMATLKKFTSTLPPEIGKAAIARGQTYLEANPADSKGAISEVMRFADEATKEQRTAEERKAEQATRHQEHEEDLRTAESNRRRDYAEHRAEIEGFQKGMFDLRGQQLTPAATKIIETTEPTVQQVDRLIGDIDKLGLQNNNQAGYLFGSRLKYAMGMASPEGTLGDDIAGLSLGSVVEAGSAMQGTSRSLVALKKALVHTPNAWKDSPMLMRRKLVEIKQRLTDMMADARKYGTKNVQPESAPSGPLSDSDIDKALDSAFGAKQ